MTLSAIRQGIVSGLAAAGLGNAVETHPGRLTARELKTFVVKGASTVRVACLGIPKTEKTSAGTELETAWAAYIMVLDKAGAPKDAAAMIIAGSVALEVAGNRWGRDDLDDPTSIRADNLYSGTVEKRALALWAVSWRQAWTPDPVDASTLSDLLSVVTDWQADPDADGEPELIDTVEFEI